MAINNLRRFYLHKRIDDRQNDVDASMIWQGKQEAIPGTALPTDFPHLSVLAEIGYTTTDDLDGADADELRKAGLTPAQAEQVIAAL